MEQVNILAITQARTGSTRLPNKVLKTIAGKTLLQIHIDRIKQSKKINKIVIATTENSEDAAIASAAENFGVDCYRGSENNVLDRFYQAAKGHNPKWVVRLTSDCPLIDPKLIDAVIEKAIKEDVDYCSNTLAPSFPDGTDVEVFKFEALQSAWEKATLDSDKEHVTPYIYRNSGFKGQTEFISSNYKSEVDYSHVRLTVDEEKDFEVVEKLITDLGTNEDWKTYADYYANNPSIKIMNNHIARNEGYLKSIKNNKP